MDYRIWFCNSCYQVSVEERLKKRQTHLWGVEEAILCKEGKACHLKQVQLGKNFL